MLALRRGLLYSASTLSCSACFFIYVQESQKSHQKIYCENKIKGGEREEGEGGKREGKRERGKERGKKREGERGEGKEERGVLQRYIHLKTNKEIPNSNNMDPPTPNPTYSPSVGMSLPKIN